MRKLFVCFLVLLVSACASTPPTKFYNLVPYKVENAKINDSRRYVLGIEYVSVPSYLDRAQIVTISAESNTELELNEFNRWAEPLSNSMQRVVADDMYFYLKNANVRTAGANRKLFDYVISVELSKFDAKMHDKAYLDAVWTIYDNKGNALVTDKTKLEEFVNGDYNDLVLKQSILVGKLSYDIAKRISRLGPVAK